MDLAILIPIAAIVVGVPGFVAFVALIAGHTRKLKELAIRDKELEWAGSDPALGPAIDHVAEMQERLDFTERLLATREPVKKIVEVDSAHEGP